MEGLTAERLRALLDYDPETGHFTWRDRPDARPSLRSWLKDRRAGCLRAKKDYWVIRVDDVLYLAHRLAWLHMTGTWPEGEVDPRDLDGTNNCWVNLRPATSRQNSGNTACTVRNRTGLKGVLPYTNGRFTAQISIFGRSTHLGCFDTAEEANAAYAAAAKKHFGEYARAS